MGWSVKVYFSNGGYPQAVVIWVGVIHVIWRLDHWGVGPMDVN